MTAADALMLPAGPELDVAVACALGMKPCASWVYCNMGSAGGPAMMLVRDEAGREFLPDARMVPLCPHGEDGCYPAGGAGCFRYSTMIATAWSLVERFAARGHDVCVERINYGRDHGVRWAADFGVDHAVGTADTAAVAICRAAIMTAVLGKAAG